LNELNLDYIDVLILQWPGAEGVNQLSPENMVLRHEAWEVMEDFQRSGRVKALGVGYF